MGLSRVRDRRDGERVGTCKRVAVMDGGSAGTIYAVDIALVSRL